MSVGVPCFLSMVARVTETSPLAGTTVSAGLQLSWPHHTSQLLAEGEGEELVPFSPLPANGSPPQLEPAGG